eukprot:GHVU01077820.1.p1 GENE.GHVU01077820.1~~GHVU01077820.1.p1  ORF type:complete len:107 (-),score=0.64 GHVU01077820.1:99-386(-)
MGSSYIFEYPPKYIEATHKVTNAIFPPNGFLSFLLLSLHLSYFLISLYSPHVFMLFLFYEAVWQPSSIPRFRMKGASSRECYECHIDSRFMTLQR